RRPRISSASRLSGRIGLRRSALLSAEQPFPIRASLVLRRSAERHRRPYDSSAQLARRRREWSEESSGGRGLSHRGGISSRHGSSERELLGLVLSIRSVPAIHARGFQWIRR